MNRNHPFIYPDELATKARAVLRDFKLRILPVVDDNKQLLGVLSRSDIMTISSSVSTMRVKGIMSTVHFAAALDMDAVQASRQMMRIDEWYAPVVRSQRDNLYVGVLGLEHVIKAFCDKKVARLKTPLSEAMSAKRLLTCSPDDEADDVWHRMKERSFSACPVVAKGKAVGIITQQNLLESGAMFPSFEAKKGRFTSPSNISAVMRTPTLSLRSNNTVGDAAELMLQKDIGHVLVVDEKGRLLGIVDRENVLKALIK